MIIHFMLLIYALFTNIWSLQNVPAIAPDNIRLPS